jgi:hypothetical protein
MRMGNHNKICPLNVRIDCRNVRRGHIGATSSSGADLPRCGAPVLLLVVPVR